MTRGRAWLKKATKLPELSSWLTKDRGEGVVGAGGQDGGQREVIRGQGGQGADVQVIFGAFEQTPVIELLHFSRQPEGNRSDYSGPVQIEALPFLPSISAFSQWTSPSS